SREQGGCSNGSCSPTNRERPGRAGLDTHVPLRFTALGQGLLPLLPAPCPSASSVSEPVRLIPSFLTVTARINQLKIISQVSDRSSNC
ncbi:MAG TPA: hypothetical protein V6D25_00350, partial [Leptolyngbyaceae cyanobacterium]